MTRYPTKGETPIPKRELWQERIEDWKASGLSQKAWCQREQVPLSSLGYWRKRLRTEVLGDVYEAPRLIPVSLTKPGSPLTIRLGRQVTIALGASVERELRNLTVTIFLGSPPPDLSKRLKKRLAAPSRLAYRYTSTTAL